MVLVVVTSLGITLGAMGLVASYKPRRRSLAAELAVIDSLPVIPPVPSRRAGARAIARPDRFCGDRLAASLRSNTNALERLSCDLDITEHTLEDLCSQVVLSTAAGLTLIPATYFVLSAGGIHVPFILPIWSSLACGAAGLVFPIAALRFDAKNSRRRDRRIFGSYLDLVVLCLAGGMGIESALLAATGISGSSLTRRLHTALLVARDTGEASWQALARIGDDLAIRELAEVSSALQLAGTEGTRVRATLAAKANSIRRHELADAEIEANMLTERLFIPGVFLLVGFLVFIGYPAFSRLSTGL